MTPAYRALVFTAARTGGRWGELAGLRREHLDLEHAQLKVRTVLTRLRGPDRRMYPGPKDYPKSDFARRTIGLPSAVVETLEEMPPSEYVFTSSAASTSPRMTPTI